MDRLEITDRDLRMAATGLFLVGLITGWLIGLLEIGG